MDTAKPDPRTTARPTAADVAARAEISIFTVQRVFNRPHTVSEKTRQRILTAARELGYTPNVLGRALSTGKVSTAALVMLARRTGELLGDTFTGFYEMLTASGYDVVVSIVPQHATPIDWVTQLVRSGRCGGLAIHLESISAEMLHSLEALNVPVVLLYTSLPEHKNPRNIHAVGFDNETGSQQTVAHLVALGHRDIAYFGGTPGWPDTLARENGFRAALGLAGLPVRKEWVVACDFEQFESSVQAAFNRVFSRIGSRKPTAIVCASDKLARAAIRAAAGWGLSVPGNLSITGFDDDNWAAYHVPPLTTVSFPRREIAAAAADMLIRQFRDDKAATPNLILPTTLVVRESTARPAPQARTKN